MGTASRYRLIAAVIVAIICQALLLRMPAVESDEGFFAACAVRQIIERAMPLASCVDTKPPGIFLLYEGAFRLFGLYNPIGLRLLWIGFALGLAAAVGAIRRASGAREDAAALALLFLTTSNYFLAFKTELPAVALATAGIAFALGRGSGKLVLAGALIGVATLFKQPSALLLTVAAFAARPCRWRDALGWVRAGLLLTLGCAVPIAALAAIYWHAGQLETLIEQTWVRPSLYALHKSQGYSVVSAAIGLMQLLIAPLCVVGLFAASAWQRRTTGANKDLLAIAYLCVALVFVAAGGHFFASYALIAIPPIALLLTRTSLPRSVREPGGLLFVGGVITCLVVAATTIVTLRQAETTDTELAREINRSARPYERLYVWGYVPELYPATRRVPASSYIASSMLFGYFHDSSADLPYDAGMRFVLPGDWDAFLNEIGDQAFLLLDNSAIRMGAPRNFAPENFARMRAFMATRCQRVQLIGEFALSRCTPRRNNFRQPAR